MRRSRGLTGPDNGRFVRLLGMVIMDCVSGVFDLSMLSKLLPMLVKDSSPASLS
jgi:hypothetical protein